jgi:hypothetical protein
MGNDVEIETYDENMTILHHSMPARISAHIPHPAHESNRRMQRFERFVTLGNRMFLRPFPAQPVSSRARSMASSTRPTAMRRMPSGGLFGALALGMITIENPGIAASLRRSCPRDVGRISPARPTSPKTASPRGRARLRREDTIARRIARSAAGSLILTPPTALTKTPWSKHTMPACR